MTDMATHVLDTGRDCFLIQNSQGSEFAWWYMRVVLVVVVLL